MINYKSEIQGTFGLKNLLGKVNNTHYLVVWKLRKNGAVPPHPYTPCHFVLLI
jgi:hypothetical protein